MRVAVVPSNSTGPPDLSDGPVERVAGTSDVPGPGIAHARSVASEPFDRRVARRRIGRPDARQVHRDRVPFDDSTRITSA